METIFWETHNNALFNVFIRDLSMGNINLKHMILDNDRISDNDKLNSHITNKNLKKKRMGKIAKLIAKKKIMRTCLLLYQRKICLPFPDVV